MYDARYQPILATARPRAALWRLLTGAVTIIVVAFAWMAATLGIVSLFRGARFATIANGTLDLSAEGPRDTLVFLLLVVGLGAGAIAAARIWHGRRLRDLMGRGPVVMRDFAKAVAITWCVALTLTVAALPFGEPLVPNLSLEVWLKWLPLGLIAVALQTGSEELMFRGYLQSQLAARFRTPIAWMLVPALLFGAAHYLPGLPFSASLTYVAVATIFGLIAADLTATTGSLGAAWGFHFANNSIAILFVATDGTLSGLGLYKSGNVAQALMPSPLLLIDLAAMLGVWILIRRMVSA